MRHTLSYANRPNFVVFSSRSDDGHMVKVTLYATIVVYYTVNEESRASTGQSINRALACKEVLQQPA